MKHNQVIAGILVALFLVIATTFGTSGCGGGSGSTGTTSTTAGTFTPLARREFVLLELLALRAGEVVSRAEIEAHLYDENADLMSNAVDSAVCVLRRKIQPPGSAALLHTRRGHGYVLAVENH